MDLTSLLLDDVNVVDIYLLPKREDAGPSITVGWDKPIQNIPPTFGKGTSQTFVEYYHRELAYVYDTQNDGQRLLKKNLKHHILQYPFSYYAFAEEQLPSHRFPCSDEITHKQELQRTTYRINNRVSFIVDYEPDNSTYYHYIRYIHAPNVDTKKVESDLKYALSQCKKFMLSR